MPFDVTSLEILTRVATWLRLYGKDTLDRLTAPAGPGEYVSSGMEGLLTPMTVAAIQNQGFFKNVKVSKEGVDLVVELDDTHPSDGRTTVAIELKASGDPKHAASWVVKGFTEYDPGGPKVGKPGPDFVLYLVRKQPMEFPAGYESIALDVSKDWQLGALKKS